MRLLLAYILFYLPFFVQAAPKRAEEPSAAITQSSSCVDHLLSKPLAGLNASISIMVSAQSLPSGLGRQFVFQDKDGHAVTQFELESTALHNIELNQTLFDDRKNRNDLFAREAVTHNRGMEHILYPLIPILIGAKIEVTSQKYIMTIINAVEWSSILRSAGQEIEVLTGPAFISVFPLIHANAHKYTVPQATGTGHMSHDVFGHRLGYLSMPPIFRKILREIAKHDEIVMSDPIVQRLINRYGVEALGKFGFSSNTFTKSTRILEAVSDGLNVFDKTNAIKKYELFLNILESYKSADSQSYDHLTRVGIKVTPEEVAHINQISQISLDPKLLQEVYDSTDSPEKLNKLIEDQIKELKDFAERIRSTVGNYLSLERGANE